MLLGRGPGKRTYTYIWRGLRLAKGALPMRDVTCAQQRARTPASCIMAGPDEIDAKGWRLRLAPARKRSLADYKVALMLDEPSAEVDRAVQDLLQALADFLARQGVKVDDRARPDIDTAEAHALYVKLLRAATSGRQTDEDFARNQALARTLAADDDSYFARMTRANVLSHRDWLAANEARHKMRLKWAAFFEDTDLLLSPAAASAAFPHDQEGERHERAILVNGKPQPTTDQLFWAGFSGMVYLPATVAPVGFTAEGLPVGVQIVGPQYGDRTCIQFARLIERDYQGFVPPPEFP